MGLRTKHWAWGIFSIVLILIGARLLLPFWVQDYVNRKLDEIPEYDGTVGDIDIHLIRGAYSIDEVDIVKTTGRVPIPFFSATTVDLSVQWKELFHGALVGEIEVLRGNLNFVKGESDQESQTSVDSVWLEVVKDLFPFRINRFALTESQVWFYDFGSDPQVDVYLTNLVAVCTNLYNTRNLQTDLPADFIGTGVTLGGGEVEIQVKLDPLADEPKFDLELGLENMDLTAINDVLEAYANFNVKRGTFEVFSEIAAEGGEFDGYVKPFFNDLNVFELEQDSDDPLELVWQAIVAGAVKIFKNYPEDQVATKIPVSGTFEKTDVDIWTTVVNVLRNAFIEAFQAEIDESINLFNREQEAKSEE